VARKPSFDHLTNNDCHVPNHPAGIPKQFVELASPHLFFKSILFIIEIFKAIAYADQKEFFVGGIYLFNSYLLLLRRDGPVDRTACYDQGYDQE